MSVQSFYASPMPRHSWLKFISHVTRELPYNVPFSAKVEAINLSFDQWEEISIRCADTITKACRAEALVITRAIFGRFSYSELDRAAECVYPHS